ncbi:DUF2795 domain-containing protein [Streptomyces tsukubensis]|uniref:DUF2795 domain-containing protein n=1 Tax=Streptomyces tsukubensis TaxID=83656 RepID=A0A1V4ACV8_9ACTN|nr:DUF2795 domain-containing protein [Streptomyces tsukubensis]OON81757.1 hypothetical protein B1H18_06435 [Streptomyces tsukubensis]QFR96539.1 DUF2795 domain-containing protein [Streptomyces tsukubensis]
MQRGSNRLSAHRDDELKHELQGMLKAGHSTRTAEWHDPEPAADDDPAVASGPVTPSRSPGPVAMVRHDLARLLGRTSFPDTAPALIRVLREQHAPDSVVDPLLDLPEDTVYGTVHELAEALVEAGAGAYGAT